MSGRAWPTQTAADNTSAGTKPYRYGFNGKESDFEVKNIGGSQQDYGMRIYDPRLGRFLSVDPLTKSYPMLTPYQFASNTPIQAVDWDGGEARYSKLIKTDGSTVITIMISLKVKNTANVSGASLFAKANGIKEQIESSYQGYDAGTKTTYKTIVKLDYTSEIDTKKDYYLDITNDIEFSDNPNTVGRTGLDETDAGIGMTENNRFQVLSDRDTPQELKRSGAHEWGHGTGLRHGKNKDNKQDLDLEADNLMRQSNETNGTRISLGQLKKIIQTIDKKENVRDQRENNKRKNVGKRAGGRFTE